MNTILNWINISLFKDPNQKKITDSINRIDSTNIDKKPDSNDKIDNDENSNKIKKWIPNDELWMRYNNFLTIMSDIQKKKNSETKLITQSKQLIKQYKMESISDDITSKMNALQTKQHLIDIESKIKRVQIAIKELENADGKILEEYDEYLNSAREFLIRTGLDTFINVNDILCSTNLYVLMRKTFDSFYLTRMNDDDKLKQIAKISTYFEPGKIKNISEISHKEFQTKRKEILNKVSHLHITDDLTKTFNLEYLSNPRIEETIIAYQIQESVEGLVHKNNNDLQSIKDTENSLQIENISNENLPNENVEIKDIHNEKEVKEQSL
jgi:hypothetical protein